MSDREKAREKALATARASTLGLALAATTSGCEQVIDVACSTAPSTRYCCERAGGGYDSASGRCMFPVMGPFVPPDLPAEVSA